MVGASDVDMQCQWMDVSERGFAWVTVTALRVYMQRTNKLQQESSGMLFSVTVM